MNIILHSHGFDGRGTGKVPLDYALALRKYFNINTIFVSSNRCDNAKVPTIRQEGFEHFGYDYRLNENSTSASNIQKYLSQIVLDKQVSFAYFVTGGENDHIYPENCNVGIHCVFHMREPHGKVYAGVSEYLAKKHGQTAFVPHIIKPYAPIQDIRAKLGIPPEAFVVGRCGGNSTFDIPWVKETVNHVLNVRSDIYFLFLNTDHFYSHDRIKYVNWVESEQEKFDHIHACDCMLHARTAGETFGLAVGEFSISNKPVLTWSGNNAGYYDTCHLSILKDKAFVYHDTKHLYYMLQKFQKQHFEGKNWDAYSESFNEKTVAEQFKKVFLNE